MATDKERYRRQVLRAAEKFQTFLSDNPRDRHYLSVDKRECPLRRIDVNKAQVDTYQVTHIKQNFKWDEGQGNWIRNDGAQIVTEDEIYQVILSFQRVYPNSRYGIYFHTPSQLVQSYFQ